MAERHVIESTIQPVTRSQMGHQLGMCGLKVGQTAIVHVAMSKLGWVVGGAQVVIQALLDAIGPTGTLLIPTQSWKNLDPASGVHPTPEHWWQTIRKHWPAYDPLTTPTNTMGVVAELFRTWPGAIRTQHPVRSFAALGPNARELTASQALEEPFGENSPVGALYRLDGHILLIGVDHSSNTSLHLAEHRATYSPKSRIQEGSAVMSNGVRQWITYSSPELRGDDFAQIGDEYQAAQGMPQHRVGAATVRFMRQRPLVDWAVQWMEANR